MLDADIHVGETVAVFRQGVPGQIVAQLARLNGGEVIAVDAMTSRLELAKKLALLTDSWVIFGPGGSGRWPPILSKARAIRGSDKANP